MIGGLVDPICHAIGGLLDGVDGFEAADVFPVEYVGSEKKEKYAVFALNLAPRETIQEQPVGAAPISAVTPIRELALTVGIRFVRPDAAGEPTPLNCEIYAEALNAVDALCELPSCGADISSDGLAVVDIIDNGETEQDIEGDGVAFIGRSFSLFVETRTGG